MRFSIIRYSVCRGRTAVLLRVHYTNTRDLRNDEKFYIDRETIVGIRGLNFSRQPWMI